MSHCFTERAVSEKLGSTLSPYAYPTASNRLASVTTGSAMRKFTYDASGDILTDSRTGALGLTFGYDEEGRLIKATQTNSTANGATYSYDAQSRLSMRTVTHSTAPTTTTGIATDVPGSLASSRGSDGHATARSMGWQTAHDIIMSWPSSRAMMQDGPSVFGYAGQNVLVLTDALGLMGGRGHQGRIADYVEDALSHTTLINLKARTRIGSVQENLKDVSRKMGHRAMVWSSSRRSTMLD